jgi:hypothetical protein
MDAGDSFSNGLGQGKAAYAQGKKKKEAGDLNKNSQEQIDEISGQYQQPQLGDASGFSGNAMSRRLRAMGSFNG